MLIEFAVNNFLSIKNPTTFSMAGSNAVKELEGQDQELSNTFVDLEGRTKFLKSAVIYGANGSGKSNIIAAFGFFKSFILTSSNARQAQDDIEIYPFLFNSENELKPSGFEMIFIYDDVRYRYGFEVDKKNVHAEWLFQMSVGQSKKETNLFSRAYQEIKVNTRAFKEGKGIENNTRKNALFLSTVAQLNGAISQKIQSYFSTQINVISTPDNMTDYTVSRFIEEEHFKSQVMAFLGLINSGIEKIEIEEIDIDKIDRLTARLNSRKLQDPEWDDLVSSLSALREKFKKFDSRRGVEINLFYKKFDNTDTYTGLQPLDFGLESHGNQKLFGLLGPWFDALENGKVIIIDELDSKLHTLLTIELLKLFHSKANKKNAQLVFASHDTNLLRKDLFRRDQIWFVEKDDKGASDLYSLVEYKINHLTAVRNDASFEKDYLIGKYGAIPYFGNIDKFLNEFVNE
ncbi:ATP/GTP-binding protein [Chitinophaga sp. CF418]|uniref:AAA family ATPase n=1 Tax=Chitinophaga sp. CF418 TaxID=1855287 RepID=UPI00091409EE|nr:ATP-binding protein [Chitinophaga sp. CF418]SHM75006.1 ATPase/GTPase, AAA15 family [Chitinophaga sp. CF418]